MEQLKKHLNQLFIFPKGDLDEFISLFSERKLSKSEYFEEEGTYASKIAFMTSGVVRAFYSNKEGAEYNKTFFTETGFVGAYSSLVTGEKNKINLQCLTDCTIWVADFWAVTSLYDDNPNVERLARILAEHFFVRKEKREIEFVMLEAKERYLIFQKEHPNLENRIPQYHIASYLGITPTQLSRIRAQRS